jgi:hypothetical protein
MKLIPGIPLIVILSACNHNSAQTDQKSAADIKSDLSNTRPDHSKYHVANDVTIVVNELPDTLRYTKADFNNLVDTHPEFFSDIQENPDLTYQCMAEYGRFGSEAGRDEYYILYAYFLKQKNEGEKYAACRSRMIDIYSNINSLYAAVQYGGTYFGHQFSRIIGYAEYAVSLYKDFGQHPEKKYDISKQKGLYIKSLRQLVADEISIGPESTEQEKIDRSKELNALVDKIDKDITDIFYLRRAQEFQYRHYEYY